MIVFAAMYSALRVASGCYHRDRSITYVSCAIVSVVQTFALTRSVWKKIALILCARKTRAASGRRNALTLLVQKADAAARVVRKADTVACVVRRAFALTLCVRKKFALTLCVRKTRAASGWQMY